MRIALIGGTGDIGEGLALRFANNTDNKILIGSRSEEKAQKAVTHYEKSLTEYDIDSKLQGFGNKKAADRADIVILSVPAFYIGDTVEAIAGALDNETILITPAVGMKRDENGMHYHPPDIGSVTELVAQRASEEVPVVGAYHNLPAELLADLEAEFNFDTPVIGDNEDAVQEVVKLTNKLTGLRALVAGPLANAATVESLTPLIINITMYNDEMHDVGIKWM